ncbi:DUF4230 domain-containing protein [Sphingomonas sabuli]|uniref:DUF4230 domain-containing protein n=1 Tax=Sphingomonas sabuli TaxID=2764186 RepID=A0A7G9L4S3_9SPHN|nr:DUF4230 domain-containing protein [Sphingomonas sabuli]QNM83622.1 DUF4230 domain-containing protein [Sphingomonas sabuli]
MDRDTIRLPLLIVAVLVALLMGIALGGAGLIDRLLSGPDPKAIATSSLESMRAQNRLVTFVARFVSVSSASQSKLGFTTERTLILPGTVRYEVDLARLNQKDVAWDEGSKTLRVRLPDVEIAGPEVDLSQAREYGSGGLLATFTNSEERLDQANRAKAVADLRKQAIAQVPMRMAQDSARQAVERSFAMPLRAAGIEDAKVVARFASEDSNDPSRWDVSTSYEDAIKEAQRRRAAEGAK